MNPLVSTEWLAAQMGDASLRVFDTAVYYNDATEDLISGRDQYEKAHIPGAGFLDLTDGLSERPASLALRRPAAVRLADAFGAAGIGNQSRVVLYSSDHVMWATRIWWMLHGLGFDNKAVLDGGLDAWSREGRAIESGSNHYPPANLSFTDRSDLWVDQPEVRSAIDAPGTKVICALRPEVYAGFSPEHYGRPGHISGSLNVPHTDIVEAETNQFRSLDTIGQAFAAKGVDILDDVIAYCGGGIAATVDAFALHMLGSNQVSVYDGSLLEWSKDPTAPMSTGPNP